VNILFLSPPWAERVQVSRIVADAGHVPIVVETSAAAVARAAQGDVGVVLLDLAAGAEALRFLRNGGQHVPLPVLAIADRRQPAASAEALRLGIADLIPRPLIADDLVAGLGNAREFARITERASADPDLPQLPGGVFGASAAMRDVLGLVRRAGRSRCNVLIVGERGTGRETIARAIQNQGPDTGAEFVKVVCGTLDRAAFGASLDAAEATDTTLYLEDLCELPLDLQRQLEARIGSGGERVPRVLGAPQPRIMELIERGAFRTSLLEAIAVVRIDLPPLRHRRDDIPVLAMHFLKEACRRHDVPGKSFSRGALALLSALPWNGNATELRGLAERLSIVVPRGVVLLEDVLANVRLDTGEAMGGPGGSLKSARDQFERDYVTDVLQHHRGRMGAAAKELGIERTNLYRKIKQLNIQWRPSA
jgi:DNA-binding NtrC family response regulator